MLSVFVKHGLFALMLLYVSQCSVHKLETVFRLSFLTANSFLKYVYKISDALKTANCSVFCIIHLFQTRFPEAHYANNILQYFTAIK